MLRRGGFREGVNILRQVMAVELSAERNRALCRRRVTEAARRIAFAEHTLIADGVVTGSAAEVLRGNLEQLRLRIRRAGMIRARHRMRRLTSDRQAGPRQSLAG